MSYVHAHRVELVTDASGNAIGYTEVVTGRVCTIRYVKNDFADGSTITVTNETTGETIWSESSVNASATRAPRQATHSTAGAAAVYASGGSAVLDRIVVAGARIKVVVASGGNTKSGTFHVVLD
ncbi:MAG: hypothetical protein WDN25_03935 [Acetobacteraceae bacterium]